MRVLVLDDDLYFRNKIKDYLECLQFKLDIDLSIHYVSNIDELFQYEYIQLLILDIDIQNINIIDYYQEIINHYPHTLICYLTNHMTYMPKAFGYNVIKYIEKKEMNQLENVIKFVYKHYDQKAIHFKLEEGYRKFMVNEIIYIESVNKKIYLHTKDQSMRLYESGIQYICSLLPKQFVLINKQEIINLDLVILLSKSEVKLKHLNQSLYISRRKYKEVYKKFIEWSDHQSYESFK